ncbi:MAG TPA: transposase [Rhodanobacteraceae bacterium]
MTTKTNLAALELMRHLRVGWKCAWRLKYKVLHVMAPGDTSYRLAGYVRIDDAYLGVARNGSDVARGAPCRQAFMVTVATSAELECPRRAVPEPVQAFENASFQGWYTQRAPDAEVDSDGLAYFAQAAGNGHTYSVLVTPDARAATEGRDARCVNVLLANAKRTISGR